MYKNVYIYSNNTELNKIYEINDIPLDWKSK